MNTLEIVNLGLGDTKPQAAVRAFIEQLSPEDVYALCRNGTIWADPSFAADQSAFASTLFVGGNAADNAVRQWAAFQDLVLLCDYAGLADAFVDEDVVPSHDSVRFTTEAGRAELLRTPDEFAGDWDGFLSRLPEEP